MSILRSRNCDSVFILRSLLGSNVQQLALLVPLVLTLFVLLSAFAWFFPRLTGGVLLTITAVVVAVVATLELEDAGLSKAYAYVVGYALAQPTILILMTLPAQFDAREYWQLGRLPTIALDTLLHIASGLILGVLAVAALSELGLLAGDRGTAALSAVTLGSALTFLYRTRRFRSDTSDDSLTAVSL